MLHSPMMGVILTIKQVNNNNNNNMVLINFLLKHNQHPSAWGPSILNIAPPGAQPSYESEQQMQYRLQPSISEDWKNQFFPQHQQRAHVQPQNNIGVPNALFSQDDRNSDSVDTESDDLLLIQSMRNLRFDLDSPAPDESGGNVAFGWGNLEGDKR